MSKANMTVAITGDIDTFEREDEHCLSQYLGLLESHGIRCTLPVTADAVAQYPERARYIVGRGHEIAGHGDVHEPFKGPAAQQIKRMERMIDIIFQHTGVRVRGVRAPFVSFDANMFPAITATGLCYDSTCKVFGVMCKYIPYYRKHYTNGWGYGLMRPFLKALGYFYNVLNGRRNGPFLRDGAIEIPVIGDSDYTLIDSPHGPHYQKGNGLKVGEVWLEHVRALRGHQRAVALQAHPWRVTPNYLDDLDYFCTQCREMGITFATLGEIADIEGKRRVNAG